MKSSIFFLALFMAACTELNNPVTHDALPAAKLLADRSMPTDVEWPCGQDSVWSIFTGRFTFYIASDAVAVSERRDSFKRLLRTHDAVVSVVGESCRLTSSLVSPDSVVRIFRGHVWRDNIYRYYLEQDDESYLINRRYVSADGTYRPPFEQVWYRDFLDLDNRNEPRPEGLYELRSQYHIRAYYLPVNFSAAALDTLITIPQDDRPFLEDVVVDMAQEATSDEEKPKRPPRTFTSGDVSVTSGSDGGGPPSTGQGSSNQNPGDQNGDALEFESDFSSRTLLVGKTYRFTLPAARGGTPPLQYSVSGLPPWLSFSSSDRTLSGTPPNEAVIQCLYTVRDANGQERFDSFNIIVGNPPKKTPPASSYISSITSGGFIYWVPQKKTRLGTFGRKTWGPCFKYHVDETRKEDESYVYFVVTRGGDTSKNWTYGYTVTRPGKGSVYEERLFNAGESSVNLAFSLTAPGTVTISSGDHSASATRPATRPNKDSCVRVECSSEAPRCTGSFRPFLTEHCKFWWDKPNPCQ